MAYRSSVVRLELGEAAAPSLAVLEPPAKSCQFHEVTKLSKSSPVTGRLLDAGRRRIDDLIQRRDG